MEIKKGDIVIAECGYKWSRKRLVVTDVKADKSCRSGIGVQTTINKSYYDSKWFTVVQTLNEGLIEQLQSSEIF